MIYSVCIYVLLCFASLAHGVPEVVWLEDLTPNHELRHLEMGLPQHLEFNLKRGTKTVTNLILEENRKLNANAPVFEAVMEGNQQRVIRRDTQPIRDVKFYHDKRNVAALQVSCAVLLDGPCQRVMEGSLSFNGDSYEIKPASSSLTVRGLGSGTSIPHFLEKVELRHNLHGDRQFGIFGTDYKRIKDGPEEHDHVPIPGGQNVREDLLEELRSLINKDGQDIELKNVQSVKRQVRQTSTGQFAIEVYMVGDPALWNKYYAVTGGENDKERELKTEYTLRKKLANVMNGVSLKYEMIDNPNMNVFVTISGFEFFKISYSSPLFSEYNVIYSGGKEYAESGIYISGLPGWVRTQSRLRDHDHIMVITGYELYYDGDIRKTEVAGIAYVSGACSSYGVSVQEDTGYFVLTTVAAHELGHNVGADHDGDGSSASCPAQERYLMAPYVASFGPNSPYTINPWRFSKCSVDAFIEFFNNVPCLKDEGEYWNKTEWEEHNSKLPGELYSAEEQCDLLYGSQSGLCYLWCIDGLCQEKPNEGTTKASTTSTTAKTMSTTASTTSTTSKTTSTTTRKPSSTTTEAKICVDIGWKDWSCKKVSDYFYAIYGYKPSYWCRDPNWAKACCAFCAGSFETTTEACVDIGHSSLTCVQVSDFYRSAYGILPRSWCATGEWKKKCCRLCRANGA